MSLNCVMMMIYHYLKLNQKKKNPIKVLQEKRKWKQKMKFMKRKIFQ